MTIVISPTEPLFRALGPISPIPENYGVDFCFGARGGLYGVQRKEYGDFVASVMDGRLGKELGQMTRLHQAILCIEGRPQWTTEGMWLGPTRWSHSAHYGYLWSVRMRGVWVEWTDTAADTGQLVQCWERYVNKDTHSALVSRGGPPAPAWGTATNMEYVEWMLQSMPGVGSKLAHEIVQALGCPLGWREGIDAKVFMSVPGIGKTKAQRLMDVFSSSEG